MASAFPFLLPLREKVATGSERSRILRKNLGDG